MIDNILFFGFITFCFKYICRICYFIQPLTQNIILKLTPLATLMNRFRGNLTINITQENQISNNESPVRQINEAAFHEHVDSDQEKEKITNNDLNLIEFEQYTVEKPNKSEKNKKNRTFNIDIPQSKPNQKTLKNNSFNGFKPTKFMSNSQNSPVEVKQPPAPSKGSKKTKVFIFPTKSTEQGCEDSDYKKSERSQNFGQKKNALEQEWHNYRALKEQFERQRQEFYRQKSKYERQLLVKDAQIQLLQKIVTQKYPVQQPEQKDFSQLQAILLQKDIQINELLQKITSINELLQRKNEQLNKAKYDSMHLQNIVESLKNQLFIYQRKQQSDKITKQFYYHRNIDKSHNTPKQGNMTLNIHKWQGDSSRNQVRGIQQLQKRLQFLKLNRMEIEQKQRNKVRSEYSQTSKSKGSSKGMFDFKGRVYGDKNSRVVY